MEASAALRPGGSSLADKSPSFHQWGRSRLAALHRHTLPGRRQQRTPANSRRHVLRVQALKHYSGHETPVSSPIVNEKGIVVSASYTCNLITPTCTSGEVVLLVTTEPCVVPSDPIKPVLHPPTWS